jgi:hypothetical protein
VTSAAANDSAAEMASRDLDPAAFLRQTDADLHEVLRGPVDALAGVSPDAVAALGRVGVQTAFDLATSALFALADEVAHGAESSSLASRFGVTPNDWLEPGTTFESAADIPGLPLASLRGLDAESAAAVAAALGVATIRELASWPPRIVARGLLARAIGAVPAADDEDAGAEVLRPRLGDYPTERVYYDRLVMLHTDEDANLRKPIDGPVSLSPTAKPGFAFDRIAVGAMLTYAQSWFAEGLTLGQLLHSLALAPGEATRIAVIDWSRRTSAFTSEAITEQEQLDNTATHARALSEVQSAVANEMQQGASATSGWTDARSTASASSGSSGIVQSILGGSSSGSETEQEATTAFGARSSSWSQGSRSVTANLEQHVNDRTEQHATSVRNRRASAVREVSQSEHEDVSTRIVANYNHMHALTVQYFEVVQLYRTRTQLHRSERCLFIPMAYPDFGASDAIDLVQRFRGALLVAAQTARARDLLADESTSVTVYPVRPPRIVIDPVPIGPATTATAARAARLRPIEAVRALSATATASAASSSSDASVAGGGAPPQTEVSSAWEWDPTVISRAMNLIGRPILRPGVPDARLPEEAVLVGIDFDGIDAASVQLERPGVTAADSTFGVPPELSSLDLVPGVPLDAITGIRVAKQGDDPASGSIKLRCTLYGRQFETPRLTVSLGHGTGLGRVARLESDRADRQVELLEHLQANVAHYGQAMFRSLDTATIVGLLAPYTWNGKPLVDLVEPTPVTVAGNFLVLRAPVDADEDSGVPGKTWGVLIDDLGIGSRSDERLVPIATSGVFAEAVLGRSNSAEKLDITRFWNWQDSPAPLTPPEIAPVATGTRATPEDLTPGQLGPPVVNITNPTALPEPGAGLSAVLGAVAAANMFRDMSGLAGTQQLAQSAVQGTLSAATAAGQMANETLRAEIQRQMAEMQLAADVAKAAIGKPPDPDKSAGISGQGAKINQGKSMDDRKVGGGANSTSSTTSAPSGGDTMDTGAATGDDSAGTDTMTTASGDEMPTLSREAAYTDQASLGYSPGGLSNLLGGLPVQPAVYPQPGGGGGGSGSVTLPQSVQDFQDILKNALFPKDPAIQKVTFDVLDSSIYFPPLATMGYGAWTNSATHIFVADLTGAQNPLTGKALTPGQIRTLMAIAARHESNHIRQFAANGGPPKSYAQMMDFEQKAYTDTAAWLQTPQAASVASDAAWRKVERQSSLIYAKAFKDEIARVNKLGAGIREGAFKDFLVGTSSTNTIRKALRNAKLPADPTGDAEPMLPPHSKLADLY